MPSQRQARLYQQLVCGQPARQAPLENGSRDVRGEIAEADKPRENQLQKSGERIIVFRQWVGWRRSAARGTIKAPKLSVRLEGLRPSEPERRNPVVCLRLAPFGFAVGAWDSFNRIKGAGTYFGIEAPQASASSRNADCQFRVTTSWAQFRNCAP